MKNLIAFISLMVLCGLGNDLVQAKDKSQKKHPKSQLEVSVLNSPVAGNEAVFEFKISKEHSVAKATYQIFAKKEMKPKVVTLEKKSNDQYEAKIDVSSLADGDYKIKFNIFSKKGKKHHHFFGKDKKHWVGFSIKRSVVVVDPGEEGKKTLLGIDVDNDGVRDDLQVYIRDNFVDKPVISQALYQTARYYQLEMINVGNKELSIQTTHKKLKSYDCLSYAMQDMESKDRLEVVGKIRGLFLNTKSRILTSRKVSENFHGESSSIPNSRNAGRIFCEFISSFDL